MQVMQFTINHSDQATTVVCRVVVVVRSLKTWLVLPRILITEDIEQFMGGCMLAAADIT